MNTTVIAYTGLFVALLISMGAVLLIYRRYLEHKNATTRAMHTWLPFPTTTPDPSVPPTTTPATNQQGEDIAHDRHDLNTQAQQNGHYSEHKGKL